MLTIRCDTAAFKGQGRIDCYDCGRTTRFPDDCHVVMLRIGDVTTIWDAKTEVVLHDCREFVLEPPRRRRHDHVF
jgi:hypothetical protein